MKLSDLASRFPVAVERDADFRVLGYVTHKNPRPGMLVYCESEAFLDKVRQNPAVACVLTTAALASKLAGTQYGILVGAQPGRLFFEIHNYLTTQTNFYGEAFASRIAPSAKIHPRAYVAEHNVVIGEGCVIEPHVTILPGTTLGKEVTIRAGTVIGSEGFEFKKYPDQVMRIEHAGGVLLGDRVEIQANCTVDRGVFGNNTEIGEDTKLDNMVHVAHGVVIGKRCLLPAATMLAGAVHIGNDVWIDPCSCVSHELSIGDNAKVTIGSVVTQDVPAGARVAGNFAVDFKKFIAFVKSIS